MSDWWTRKLGRAAPAAAPPREPRALDAWWATPPPSPAAQAPDPAAPPAPAQDTDGAARRATARAQWAKNPMTCPECESGDYFSPGPRQTPRCYTCGYPVLHSTSGAGIPDGTGEATPARQLRESLTNDFQPHKIIGRVGKRNGQ